jgi:hypothetical protein
MASYGCGGWFLVDYSDAGGGLKSALPRAD